MAVVIVKGKHITDRDLNKLSGASRQGGLVRNGCGAADITSGDSIGSKVLLCTIPSNARIVDLKLTNDAITSAAGDIGLYASTQDGGAAVDVDFFVAAKSLASAAYQSTVTFTGAAADIGFGEKMVWENLGLSADPQVFYDVVVTLTAAATATGTVGLHVNFVI